VIDQKPVLVEIRAKVDHLGGMVDLVVLEVVEVQAGVASEEALVVEAVLEVEVPVGEALAAVGEEGSMVSLQRGAVESLMG
jgi:hypothetical protein